MPAVVFSLPTNDIPVNGRLGMFQLLVPEYLSSLTLPSIISMFTREASVYRLGIVGGNNALKERTAE